MRLLLGLAAFALDAREIGEASVTRDTVLLGYAGVKARLVGRRMADTARFGDCADADERQDDLDQLEKALRFGRWGEHGSTVRPVS